MNDQNAVRDWEVDQKFTFVGARSRARRWGRVKRGPRWPGRYNGQADRIDYVTARDPLLPPPEVCDWLLKLFGDPDGAWAEQEDLFGVERVDATRDIVVEMDGIDTLKWLKADQLKRQAEHQEAEQP